MKKKGNKVFPLWFHLFYHLISDDLFINFKEKDKMGEKIEGVWKDIKMEI